MGTREAAERLGKTQQGIRYMIRFGIIQARREGRDWRIPVSEIERYERRESSGRGVEGESGNENT